MLARNEEQLTALTIGILRYSRDLAFAAAIGLCRRGRGPRRVGQPDGGQRRRRRRPRRHRPRTAVPGRRAELGHHRAGDRRRRHAAGRARRDASEDVREIALRHGRAALSDVHGTWLIAIVSGPLAPTDKFLRELLDVVRRRAGGDRADRADASPRRTPAPPRRSSGMNAVAGWSGAPRPVLARELLPERALLGDARPSRCCDTEVMRPLADAGPALTETLDAYLDSRRSHRGVRPQIVRSSKYRPVPAQADHRLHRPRSHHAARRLRAAGGRDRRPARHRRRPTRPRQIRAVAQRHTDRVVRTSAPVEGCRLRSRWKSHHMLICGDSTKT